jgi:hypothetical protein
MVWYDTRDGVDGWIGRTDGTGGRGERKMMMMMDDGWGRKRRSQGSVE